MSVSSVNYPYIYKIFFVGSNRRIQRIPMRTKRWYSSVIHLSAVDNPETAQLHGARCLSSAIRFYVLPLFKSGLSSLWKIYLVQRVAMIRSRVFEQLIEITRLFLFSFTTNEGKGGDGFGEFWTSWASFTFTGVERGFTCTNLFFYIMNSQLENCNSLDGHFYVNIFIYIENFNENFQYLFISEYIEIQ